MDKDKLIIELFQAGYSDIEIAREAKVSLKYVYQVLDNYTDKCYSKVYGDGAYYQYRKNWFTS